MGEYKRLYGDFDRAAVAYARGKGGLRRFEQEADPSDHIYSKHVERVREKLSDLPA